MGFAVIDFKPVPPEKGDAFYMFCNCTKNYPQRFVVEAVLSESPLTFRLVCPECAAVVEVVTEVIQ